MATYSIAALKKLNKEDMQSIIMDLQEKYNESVKISQDINELKNQFLSMKEELRVAKESNMELTKRLVTAERYPGETHNIPGGNAWN